MLTAAREKRGLSIEDAAHETRITAQRLRHLESGNFAAFGSMTYARSFIRQYGDFLEVDATDILDQLPGGVLGGERDYRYLTESHGAWLRDRNVHEKQAAEPVTGRVRTIKSPLPAALVVFVLILAGTAMWGKHMASMRNQVEPGALKALPVSEEPIATPQTEPNVATAPAPQKHSALSAPVFVRKAERID